MRKGLSLKKTPQTQPLKNQKAITQFFKQNNGISNPDLEDELLKNDGRQSADNTKIKVKRKACSPVQVGVQQINSNGNCGGDDKDMKKIKLCSDQSLNKTKICKREHRSPQKENNQNCQLTEYKSKCTPTKINNTCISCDDQSKAVENISPKHNTPKKSLITELRRSPSIAKLLSPDKLSGKSNKNGTPVKVLDFEQHDEVGDLFDDEWELAGIDEEQPEDLELSVMQRCEILNVVMHPTRKELKLKNASNHKGTCFIEGLWLDTPLSPGDIVSIIASKDSTGFFSVGNICGLIVLHPDHLISATSVVSGVFCERKAVLQERWRGLDSANSAMTIGTIIHELVQKVLAESIIDIRQINKEVDVIIKNSIQLLYDAGLTEEELKKNMLLYIPPLAEFMDTYVAKTPKTIVNNRQKDNWRGKINKVLDIEENLCCPQLGLKGKIDATLEVTIHDTKGEKRSTVPLELKSGKASMSAEHRGQLVLYGMMLSLQQQLDPARADQRGLLLYLKERVELREVSCGFVERRDLMMLRNQLVLHLATGPGDPDPEQIGDIEEASSVLQQKLPSPINRENVCAKCPYLTICSLHLWHTDGPTVSENHPLSKMRESALGHLSPDHIKYFLHWTALLRMEEKLQLSSSPLRSLWTDNAETREKRGTCAAKLNLNSVEASRDRFVHVFLRGKLSQEHWSGKEPKGPQEGDFSIVSIDNRPWIAAGVVVAAKEGEIHILLERDLSRRLSKSTIYHIDTYESYATTVQNLTNLGVLLDDSEASQRLRRLIIEKEPPSFEAKLPREVGRLGSRLMRALNIEQQRAVLRALAAADYALLAGLPGTGKTQTISVLIQMLVALKQRVLVTAHTHSAVDTVLSRLPDSMKVMRLGSKGRVAASVAGRCEQQLAATCHSVTQLDQLYQSMEVVGVTCLGSGHAMLARTTFDVCIVDEATQVLQCTVLRPLFAAKRFVLVGDPEQLPPVVRSRAARRLGMEESLFHRLMSEESTSTLRLQYRMNAPLASVANSVSYSDRLKCANQAVADARLTINLKKISGKLERMSWLSKACSPATEDAAVFLDVEGDPADCSAACTNRREACMVLVLVDALTEGGVKPSDIGVIAPYRDQVSLLKRSLAGRVDASTVDQFQGRDKSVIIYSCTKREDKQNVKKVKEGEVLNDQRRLAVSVTRAKHKLIVVGGSLALSRYSSLQRLTGACARVSLHAHDAQLLDSYADRLL